MTQKLRLKIAKTKAVLIIIIDNVFSIKSNNSSEHSNSLALTSIYKKTFHFFLVIIMYNKNVLEK